MLLRIKRDNVAIMDASTQLVNMAMAFSRSRIVCAAARLKVADALADNEVSIEILASECGADAVSLHRLLRAMASIGIVAEIIPGTFALTPLGQPLRSDAPNSAWHSVIFWADLLADNWTHLTECVRTGDSAAIVMQRAGITSRWSQDPDAGAVFRAVMGTAPAEKYGPITDCIDVTNSQCVADLGGGGGGLIVAILNKHPHLRGILVDHPASIESASPRIAKEGLQARCQLIAADILEAVPIGADTLILKHVLHGYDDQKAIRILRNCMLALPANGRVLVVEFALPAVVDHVDTQLEFRLMSDLNMLAVTGGKERTEAEWHALFHQAGLHQIRLVSVPGDAVAIIEWSTSFQS